MTNLIIERKTIGELGRHVEVLGLVLLAHLIRITILSTRFLVKKTTYQVWKKSTLRSWSHTALSFFSSIPWLISSTHRKGTWRWRLTNDQWRVHFSIPESAPAGPSYTPRSLHFSRRRSECPSKALEAPGARGGWLSRIIVFKISLPDQF